MKQVKIRFSVEHHNEQSSFTSFEELKQQSYSYLLLARIADFEQRLKRSAADVWLQQKLGASLHPPLQISITHEQAVSTSNEHNTKSLTP